MQQLARAEQQSKESSAIMKKDLELSEGEKSQKIKDMEKSQRQWKQEKDELLRVRIDQKLRLLFGFIMAFLFTVVLLLFLFMLCRNWRKRKRSSNFSPRS